MRTRRGAVVLGLDLSLRGAGAVVLPGHWDPRNPWAGVELVRFTEAGKLQGSERIQAIVHEIWHLAVRTGVTRSFVEEHSFSKGLMQHAFARAELVGAVKHFLRQSLEIETVPHVASSARKLLFGPQPRRNSKEWKAFIAERLGALGAPFPDEDTRDAFLIANAGRYTLGMPCLAAG